jgi:hypothetical protein
VQQAFELRMPAPAPAPPAWAAEPTGPSCVW